MNIEVKRIGRELEESYRFRKPNDGNLQMNYSVCDSYTVGS